MYIKDGIAYAEDNPIQLKVSGVRPKDNFILWIRFNNGEEKEFDFKPMLDKAAYMPLKNIDAFKNVYIDFGVPVWNNGDIDIAPEYLYQNGISVNVAV